jgi:hypothetical protein
VNNRNIGIDPATSVAYFKVVKNKSYTGGGETRISIFRPEYIDHYIKSGKVRLTSNERSELVKLLKSSPSYKSIPDNGYNFTFASVWQVLLYRFNHTNITNNDKLIFENSIKYPNGVTIPLDLPMPDYKKLEVEKR